MYTHAVIVYKPDAEPYILRRFKDRWLAHEFVGRMLEKHPDCFYEVIEIDYE